MKRLRDVGGVFVLAAMIFGPALLAAGQPPQSGQTAGQTTTQTTSQTKPAGGFSDLIDALKAMPLPRRRNRADIERQAGDLRRFENRAALTVLATRIKQRKCSGQDRRADADG